MKKLNLLILSLAIFCNYSFGITPPAAVQKAFEKKFPTATMVSWGKEGAKEWEAEFTFNGSKISANFTDDGTWLETEKAIKVIELPKAVAESIKTKFQGWVISAADKTETPKLGTIYEADLKKGKEKKSVAFREDGTLVSE
jgi:hypothetical protein